jgi:hypothetical protein
MGKEVMVYIHNEYYSVIKKKDIMICSGKWTELDITLSELARLRRTNIECSLFFVESSL